MDKIICTAYGNSKENKGIAIIEKEVSYLPQEGKCNFCIEKDDVLYVPVAEKENVIKEYRLHEGKYVLSGSYPVSHFYSHGVFYDGLLILASFSDGVDAIYDIEKHCETDVYIHSRRSSQESGRSHYVGVTPDDKYVYAVDNGLQQIYLYSVEDKRFKLISLREFSHENIRLMPYSSYSGCAYLNTEKTNRIYALKYEDGRFHIRSIEKMEASENCFSGGNGISENGERLCVSLRGDDYLNYYRINKDGTLDLLSRIRCKVMPRDVLFKKNKVYVTCTNSDVIEVYDTKNDLLNKINEISIVQPVTFAAA
ncbi:MAG: beta-propeller fold lactonase family protein [Erysipelotrichaceae bacterium]|nr:beta-propeller fold lactonase family protein [Erysipelotrichaceae bacterium]